MLSICRPGHGATCTLCCGSHNYAAEPAAIGDLLRRRNHALSVFAPAYLAARIRASRSDMTGSYYFPVSEFAVPGEPPARDAAAVQCPLLVIGETGEARCAVGDDRDVLRDCLRRYRGRTAACGARDALSDEEVLYAARLTGDWYYYPLLIHAPDHLRDCRRRWPRPEEVAGADRESLHRSLDEFLEGNPWLLRRADYYS